MAQNLKDTRLSRNFKERLDQLSCPYTENVGEEWILELIFSPGEPRIQLLQWLFSRFDSKLNELLDPQFAPPGTRMDSRIQRLLFIASNLGLCYPEEADLIRGVVQGSRQIAFLDTLLDLVCIADTADSPNSWTDARSGISSSSYRSMGDQFTADCAFIETLLTHQHIKDTFKSEVRLLPPDINKQIELNRQEKKDLDKESTSLTHLVEDANNLATKLQKQIELLKELKKLHQCADKETKLKTTIKQMMRLVLSEFDQLITSFSCCYDSDMRQWCTKSPPHLNEVGPCFKRVHTALQQFLVMISGIEMARTSFRSLCSDMHSDISRIRKELTLLSEKQTRLYGPRGVQVESLVNSLKSSVSILEDSLLRSETSFTSGGSFLNSTVASALVRIH